MKVIDLLNKIANGEEVPEKIKWGEFELEWEELGYHDYKFLGTGNHLLFQGFATSVLNDEVEIIEEDKKIEKIEYIVDEDGILFIDGFDDDREQKLQIAKKINEIIDYLEKEKQCTNYGQEKEQ